MEVRDLFLLLYAARDSFSSIDVAWQYRYDTATMDKVMALWASEQPPGSVGMLRAEAGDSATSAPTEWHFQRHLWWRKADCWREEDRTETPGHASRSITILCDGRWLTYSWPTNWLQTNLPPDEREFPAHWRVMRDGQVPDIDDRIAGVPIVDPAFLLAMHDLQIVGKTRHAGRAAVRVRAIYKRSAGLSLDSMFWSRADDYDLLVDSERGVLLRYAALFEGAEYAVASVDAIRFDAPIPDEVFTPDFASP